MYNSYRTKNSDKCQITKNQESYRIFEFELLFVLIEQENVFENINSPRK